MVRKEGTYGRYLAQCLPSSGWLLNDDHYSNVAGIMVEMGAEC